MNFIKKVNTYLLENYPLIWNTRLVWMLGVALVSHILFFIIGYLAVSNQIELQSEYRISGFYYNTSVVFFNVLLSIILLLIWIIYYLQNNAFKNLYTIKKGTLFAQFCIILVIFFINISQYYSFNEGLKLKIRNLYSWQEIDNDIKEFNKTSVFLIQNRNDYKIDSKQYPKPFPLKYESTKKGYLTNRIDTSKAYFNYKGDYYQFYKIDKKLLAKNTITEEAIATYKEVDGRYEATKNDFKYRIVKDVSGFKEDIEYCLVNYAATLYKYGQDSTAHDNRIKYYENLFRRGEEKEIKDNLRSFLNLAQKYQIKHNLNVAEWYGLLDENNYVYDANFIKETSSNIAYKIFKKEKTRKNYEITQFILTSEPQEWDRKNHYFTKKVKTESSFIDETDTTVFKNIAGNPNNVLPSITYSNFKEVPLKNIPYCDFGNLDRFFKNTHEAYQPNENEESIYFYCIMSLILGLLLFLFKITDIKTLLLSFVAAAVILIIAGLLIAYIPYSVRSILGTNVTENLIAVMIGVSVIIFSLLSFKLKWKKLITAILFSLSIFAIPLTLMFLIFMYERFVGYTYRSEDILLQWIKKYAFAVVIIIWILCIALYTKVIRKWKGLPE